MAYKMKRKRLADGRFEWEITEAAEEKVVTKKAKKEDKPAVRKTRSIKMKGYRATPKSD